ncbi:hypothetical protein CsatA_028408 [Cannabis sativa]
MILLLKEQQSFWVKAKVTAKLTNQPLWYMSCDKCNKVANACNKVADINYNEIYECIHCKNEKAIAVPRVRAFVNLEDSSSCINASIIGEPAEKLFGCTGKQLMDMDSLGHDKKLLDIIYESLNKDYIIYVRAVKKDSTIDEYKYNVVFVFDLTSDMTQAISPQPNEVGHTENKSPKRLHLPSHEITDSPMASKAKKVLFLASNKLANAAVEHVNDLSSIEKNVPKNATIEEDNEKLKDPINTELDKK